MSMITAVQHLLNNRGYETHLEPAGKHKYIDFDQLFVALGKDYADRDLILQVRHHLQDLPIKPTGTQHHEPHTLHYWNFLVVLPFYVTPSAFAPLARLVSYINKVSLLPGFYLSEADRVVMYQYTKLAVHGNIEELLLISLIAAIQNALELFILPIEEIGLEKRTLENLLEEAERELQSLPDIE